MVINRKRTVSKFSVVIPSGTPCIYNYNIDYVKANSDSLMCKLTGREVVSII